MWWRLSVVMCGVLLIGIVLTQVGSSAAPADLRLLLPPEDCPAPCFIGIQPGVTPMTEAVTILEALPWVEQLQVGYNPGGQPNTLHWQWSAASPLRPDPRYANFILSVDRLDKRVPVVISITLHTGNAFGEMVLALGGNHQIRSGHTGRVHETYVMFLYAELGILLYSEVECPLHSDSLWQAPVRVEYRAELRIVPSLPLNSYCRSLQSR